MNPVKQMALVGFMQAGNATMYAGSWRHPATEHGLLTARYYAKLGRTPNEAIYGGLLGIDHDQLADLRAAGVI